jgi:PAS domain S-box-containing protein
VSGVDDDLDLLTREQLLAELRLARAGLRRVLANGASTNASDADAEVMRFELSAQAQHIRDLHSALEGSRAHYSELFDRAPVALVTVDALGRVKDANLSAGSLLGVEPLRLRDRSFAQFLTADSARRFRVVLATCRNEEVAPFEIDLMRRDAQIVRLIAFCGAPSPIRFSESDAGSPMFALVEPPPAIAANAARGIQGGLDAALLNALRDQVLFVTSSAGDVLWWSRGAESVLHFSADEMLHQPASRVLTKDDRDERVLERERNAVMQRQAVSVERWFQRRDGLRVWLSGSASPVVLGGSIAVLYALRDESEHRAAAEERERILRAERKARADAEAANRTKDEFLARVSHELRTPLSAMNLWIEMIAESKHADPEAIVALDRAVKAETRIVDDLLDISRGMQGKLRMRLERVDLVLAVETTIESMVPQAQAKGVSIDLHAPNELWSVGDLGRLQQAVANVLSNAIKFSTTGGRVVVVVGRRGSDCLIRVRDEGQGIAPAFLPRVFEPFAQSTQSTQTPGLGLGLTIVRQIVEQHGGSVSAESAGLGLGATFTMRLPLQESTDAPVATMEPPSLTPLVGIRALVIEDESTVREALAAFLLRHGIQVEIAASADEAWARMQRQRPDVILCDVMMPGEDGISLIRRMREAEMRAAKPPIPAAAITANGQKANRAAALAAGFQAYLTKPVNTRELMETIAQLARGERGAPRDFARKH